MTIALLILTLAWVVALVIEVLPLLKLPLARQKRDVIWFMTGLVTVALCTSWLAWEHLHIVTGLLLLASCVIASVTFLFLRRVDYYLDDLLHEVFLILVTCTVIVMCTSLWYWGIAQPVLPLLLLRSIVVFLPVAGILSFGIALKEDHAWWMIVVFILVTIVKTILNPLWGVWTIVLVLLYSILVGYVLHWMTETTYAEKMFAWNVSPSKIWILVVLSAGILVLVF